MPILDPSFGKDYLGINITILVQIENSNNTNGYLSNISGAVPWKVLDQDPDLDPDLCQFWILSFGSWVISETALLI